MTKGPILVAAAVIENSAGEILIARRPLHHKVAGGEWEFPGGKVEPGEDPRSTVRREISEELGLDIAVGDLVDVSSHVYPLESGDDLHVVLIGYHCSLLGGELRLNDVAEIAWIARAEYATVLLGRPVAAADMPLFQRVFGV